MFSKVSITTNTGFNLSDDQEEADVVTSSILLICLSQTKCIVSYLSLCKMKILKYKEDTVRGRSDRNAFVVFLWALGALCIWRCTLNASS